jgi:hypothetical protein
VNFDDPGTYHLYYGDRVGNPGTILTFFPWEHAAPGRGGVGLAQQTTFRIPLGSIGYWTHRFVETGVAHEALEKRFGEPVLSFTDPDGLSLALVGTAGAEFETASNSGNIPAEHAIRGFHGVTLMLDDACQRQPCCATFWDSRTSAKTGHSPASVPANPSVASSTFARRRVF